MKLFVFKLVAMETKLGDTWPANDSETQLKPQKLNCGCLPACFQISYSKIESTSDLSTLNKVKQEYILGRDPAYFRYFCSTTIGKNIKKL